MKILVTGFDPFGGESINPAYEAVKLLADEIDGAEIIKAELPTVFGKCAEVLERTIKAHQPDVVLCVGQAGGRAGISMERVAINLADASMTDNEQQQPSDEPIIEGGPAAYFSNLPINTIVQHIKHNGIPSSISYTAGTFVCNDVMYRLLHMIEQKYHAMRGGFIHVPFDTAQAAVKANGTPSMPIPTIAEGLRYAIEAIIESN